MHKLALLHGWQSTQSSVNSGDPSYSVADGIVHLSGGLRQPAGGNKIFAKLPPAARPAHFMWIPVYNDGGAVGYIMINTFGTMEAFSISGNPAQAYTSLAGISYPLNS